MSALLTIPLLILTIIEQVISSAGDQSPYYKKCLEKCSSVICNNDGYGFKEDYEVPLILYWTRWSCLDECKYDCMWKTVDEFHKRKWRTPQFYGKWPFVRFFGMQEPASVIFSLLNAFVHYKMFLKLKREVKKDSPLVWLWCAYFAICLHAWFWSAVFHARDSDLTELLDYVSAFSVVLMNFYVFTIRLFHNIASRFILITITALFLAFFANYVCYLAMDNIDYGFNMEINIVIGTITAICWFGWSVYNRNRGKSYSWKCAMFVALTGIAMLFEVIDTPPIFYIIDCHSLWHLSTAPIAIIFYSFAIDDCNFMKKEQETLTEMKKLV